MPQNIQNELQFFSKLSREPIYDRHLAERVIFLVGLKPNSLVLDAGCGGGYWGRAFAKSGHQVVGIDLSSEVISRASEKAVPGQSFLVGNLLEKLPFANKHFDCIICGGILHHFPDKEDVNVVVHNLYNCLKHEGKIILVEPNGSNPVVCLSRQIGCFLVKLYPDISTENETMHTVKTYINILKKNDFEIQVVKSCRHVVGRIKKVHNLLDLLLFLRLFLLSFVWKHFPQSYRGNEVIIIAGKNS